MAHLICNLFASPISSMIDEMKDLDFYRDDSSIELPHRAETDSS
jgi:hypothetical protein